MRRGTIILILALVAIIAIAGTVALAIVVRAKLRAGEMKSNFWTGIVDRGLTVVQDVGAMVAL